MDCSKGLATSNNNGVSQVKYMGEVVVVPFLKRLAVNRLDTLMISHGDNDHIGGAESLGREFPVGQVVTSVPEMIHWRDSSKCVAGMAWEWNRVVFTMIHPPEQSRFNGNIFHIHSI